MSVLLAHFLHLPQDRLFPGIDLFHATDHLLPRLARARSVFTLYDLTFHFYAKTHKLLNRWFLALMTPRFLQRADAITAISESTRRDAARLYGIDAAKIKVIYPGVSSRFRPASTEQIAEVRQRYSLPDRFILSVSTLEPRKNLGSLLEAITLLKPPLDLPLVLVGKKGWLYQGLLQKLNGLGLERRVLLTGYAPDDDLPSLYSAADLLVYPSIYEGFGLPVLEAMACGTPVVTSNPSSLPEIVGDAEVTVNPQDVHALADAIVHVLTDEARRNEMKVRGMERAAQFTWERAARETLALYQTLGGLAACRRGTCDDAFTDKTRSFSSAM